MKKLFFLLAFLSVSTFAINAQECHKTKKAASTSIEEGATCTKTAAAKLASMDENIETRTCAKSGKVSYTRKSVCPASGKVTYTDVEYCSKSAKFVNISPSDKAANCTTKATKTAAKKSCDPAACKKPCKDKASATKVSTTATKKSCDPAACKKPCKDKAKASATTTKAKAVKVNN